MVLYSTTRWVGAFYEMESLLPLKATFDFISAGTEWMIKYPPRFWEIVKGMCDCLHPFSILMNYSQLVIFI